MYSSDRSLVEPLTFKHVLRHLSFDSLIKLLDTLKFSGDIYV